MVDDELSKRDEGKSRSPAVPGREQGFGELRHYVPPDLLDISFPVSVRGYDRRAVDAHIERVNQVIAELKVRASPPAAVRHALDQAEAKVQGLLQAAREAAEEITASARRDAEQSSARAKAEAARLVVNASADADRVKAEADELIATARAAADETIAKAHAEADERLRRSQEELAALREQAEARMRELRADTDAVWQERRELLDDIRGMAGGLGAAADAAAARFPHREPARPEEDTLKPESRDDTKRPEVAPDESDQPAPAAGSGEGGEDEPREEVAARTAPAPDT